MSHWKTRPFDAANYLTNEEEMAEYLSAVMEEGNTALLAAALGDIARARGMTQLARSTGLSSAFHAKVCTKAFPASVRRIPTPCSK
ncbi:transcriptional regulator [Candidatus Symbiobacter mobilis CR]|uniref:Transcriptional regulator n=1 Tax=Candidatus Symbiobacter mobilis CR TaxID=946483 RepID=U5N7Z0_9BURK|nr:transcriptional regulator [Candidatus Symbiobacter mobilis CR]